MHRIAPRSGRGHDQFRRHPPLNGHDGVPAGAVHGDEIIGVDLLEGSHGFGDDFRRRQMPITYHSVDFVDARDLLELTDGVDNPCMATRRDDHQTAVLDVIGRGVLAPEDVRNQFAGACLYLQRHL